jgi:PAS domain-containing protein
MMSTNGHAHEFPSSDDAQELPIQPEVRQWLQAYALAQDAADRDRVVAQILESLNAQLYQERAAHSAELAAYEAQVRVLTEQMPATLWSTDTNLRVTSSTGRGLAHVGADGATFLHRRMEEIVGTQDPSSPPIAAHRRALAGASSIYEHDWRGRSFIVHIESLRGADGTIVGTVGASLDVTEWKLAERECAVQRERQARLSGMLFAARELASRVSTPSSSATSDAAAANGAADLDHLRETIDAAVTLSTAGVGQTDPLGPTHPVTPWSGPGAEDGETPPGWVID